MSIFLVYHLPCLDGAYSVLASFLFFREIHKQGISSQQFMEYISQFDSYDSITIPITATNNVKSPDQVSLLEFEEFKANPSKKAADEYNPKFNKDITYVPVKLNSFGTFDFPYNRYDECYLKESIIIIMDYSTGHPDILITVSQKFSCAIIIDHHLTFERILASLEEVRELCYT